VKPSPDGSENPFREIFFDSEATLGAVQNHISSKDRHIMMYEIVPPDISQINPTNF
jgi:hypothetical protein